MSGQDELDLLIEWNSVSMAFIDAKALRGTPEFDDDDYRAKKRAMSDLRTYWRQVRDYLNAGGTPPDVVALSPIEASTGA